MSSIQTTPLLSRSLLCTLIVANTSDSTTTGTSARLIPPRQPRQSVLIQSLQEKATKRRKGYLEQIHESINDSDSALHKNLPAITVVKRIHLLDPRHDRQHTTQPLSHLVSIPDHPSSQNPPSSMRVCPPSDLLSTQ